MQTVRELHSFRKAAIASGMSDEDIIALVNYLAQHPNAGKTPLNPLQSS